MLTILGLSFLWLVTAAVDPASSHPYQDQRSVDSVGFKLFETRLDQLELQLNKTNTLLEKIVTSLDVIQQQTSQLAVIKTCNEATTTKVYQLRLPLRASPIDVFCDMELLGGDWLVIQHRFDGSVDFNRSWAEYRDGFGVVGPASEFWLGLEAVFQLTRGGDYELLVQLRNESGHDGQIRYERFLVSGEDQEYSLSFVGGFPGTMGAMLHGNLGEGFSTYDSDNDKWSDGNCAQKFGGGWWFYECNHTNLNGPFEKDINTGRGMYWKGWTNAATYSRMLIRRR
ncbi:angiopoietin-2-like [Culex pipiens pallens]|uniref:angiopoietin-2-like n=1 Tax=Culex pipiens pallens TaxID=42434 RepID=UPI001954546E|nr:angiopoietin-2-like [Culex pipiens pallens]